MVGTVPPAGQPPPALCQVSCAQSTAHTARSRHTTPRRDRCNLQPFERRATLLQLQLGAACALGRLAAHALQRIKLLMSHAACKPRAEQLGRAERAAGGLMRPPPRGRWFSLSPPPKPSQIAAKHPNIYVSTQALLFTAYDALRRRAKHPSRPRPPQPAAAGPRAAAPTTTSSDLNL